MTPKLQEKQFSEEIRKQKMRVVVALMRKLPVWVVVYAESMAHEGDIFKHYERLTLKEARFVKRKLYRMWGTSDLAIVLDIQDALW